MSESKKVWKIKGHGEPETEAARKKYWATSKFWLSVGVIVGVISIVTALVLIFVNIDYGSVGEGGKKEFENMRILLPLYIYPTAQDADDPENAYRRAGRAIASTGGRTDVVINPANGTDATSPPNSDWVTGLGQLREEAGGSFALRNMYGYVFTTYGDRDINTIKAEIDGYFLLWGSFIGSIFFDEVSNDASKLAYYQEIVNYVRSKSAEARVILNPGVNPIDSFADLAGPEVSIVTFENLSVLWPGTNPSAIQAASSMPRKWSALVINEPNRGAIRDILLKAKERKFGNVFVTNYTDYNQLPDYFDTLVSLVASS